MSPGGLIQHLYLPLLTQETAIMVSAFAYSIAFGVSTPLLILVNTVAVITDLILFFLPTYFLSERLHRALVARFQDRYDTGMSIVSRFGAFRTAFVMGFIMPSVIAMLIVGLLRLSFWRGLTGLFVGSAVYVVVPLVVALPLAKELPPYLLPSLQWGGPIVAVVFIVLTVIRRQVTKTTVHVKDPL